MCFRDKSFLRYKLGRVFDMMDIDKDGKFERKDYLEWAKRGMENIAANGYEVTDKRRKEIERLTISVHNAFTLYGLISKNKKRFVGFHTVATQMPGFKIIAKFFFKKVFKLYDFDNSGDWSLDEYVHICCAPIGISEEEAKESFKLLDTDGNGVLDLDEIREGVTHYYSDLEENKWSYVYGPIDYDPDKWED